MSEPRSDPYEGGESEPDRTANAPPPKSPMADYQEQMHEYEERRRVTLRSAIDIWLGNMIEDPEKREAIGLAVETMMFPPRPPVPPLGPAAFPGGFPRMPAFRVKLSLEEGDEPGIVKYIMPHALLDDMRDFTIYHKTSKVTVTLRGSGVEGEIYTLEGKVARDWIEFLALHGVPLEKETLATFDVKLPSFQSTEGIDAEFG